MQGATFTPPCGLSMHCGGRNADGSCPMGSMHCGTAPVAKRCPVVDAVRADLLARSQLGIAKYGHTLAENPLSLRQWLQHAYEECLDQANYLKRAITELEAADANASPFSR